MQARVVAPFKGESFPVYVLHRVGAGRAATTAVASGPCIPSTTEDGPTPSDLKVKPPTTYVLSGASTAVIVPHKLQQSLTSPPAPHSKLTTPSRTTTPLKTNQQKSQRPSLSDQLKSISQGAQSITTQLRASYNLHDTSGPRHVSTQQSSTGYNAPFGSSYLLEATTVQLTVGRLDCRFPCPVQFASDRCTYLFQHPFEPKEIQMTMYYRDMRKVTLTLHDRTFKFRIPRALEQFGDDYRLSNAQHFLKIVFATQSEAQKVKQFLSQHKRHFTDNDDTDHDT